MAGHRLHTLVTPREREVLRLLATGQSYQEIARSLGVSVNTVRSHIRALYAKLDVTTRTEAVMVSLRAGLLEVEE